MGRFSFHAFLVVSALLVLFFSHGYGRKVMETYGHEENAFVVFEESEGKSREMIEMDYVEAGPNTNSKSGYPFSPSPISPSPEPEG